MYESDKFCSLDGCVKLNGYLDDAISVPALLDIDIVTSHNTNWQHILAETLYNKFKAVKKLTIIILDDSYLLCDYLLHQQDDTRAINVK